MVAGVARLRVRRSQCPNSCESGYQDRSRRNRYGLTLFEVLISLLIFVSAMAVVAHLVDNALRASVRSRFQTEATLRCRSLMSEFLTRERPWANVRDSRFEDDPRWSWSLNVERTPTNRLVKLEAVVRRTADRQVGDMKFQLTRFVREPDPSDYAGESQFQFVSTRASQ